MSTKYSFLYSGCDDLSYYIIDCDNITFTKDDFQNVDEYYEQCILNCMSAETVIKQLYILMSDKEELLNQLDDCLTYITDLEGRLESLGVEIK